MRVRGISSICAVVLMMASLVSAGATPDQAGMKANSPGVGSARAMGALSGNLVLTDLTELNARLDITIAHSGSASTPMDQVWVYGMIYDFPWRSGLPSWTPPGSNTFVQGSVERFHPAVVGNPYTASFTFTVPLEQQYQGFGIAFAGVSSTSTTFGFANTSSGIIIAGTGSAYIQTITQATPTTDPNAGRTGVPMLSMPAMFILGMVMAGVGVLLLRRS